MANPVIRSAQLADCEQIVAMRLLLWPECCREDEARDFDAFLSSGAASGMPATILVAQDVSGLLVGFIEVGLRSHADGCNTAHPVGFVEGWFVHEEFRGRSIGGQLMQAAEKWAREQGCQEMASDALIDNLESQNAHQALGFEVVDRCVHYRKPL